LTLALPNTFSKQHTHENQGNAYFHRGEKLSVTPLAGVLTAVDLGKIYFCSPGRNQNAKIEFDLIVLSAENFVKGTNGTTRGKKETTQWEKSLKNHVKQYKKTRSRK